MSDPNDQRRPDESGTPNPPGGGGQTSAGGQQNGEGDSNTADQPDVNRKDKETGPQKIDDPDLEKGHNPV